MVLFPNCKINLGLRIARKRSDGYHDIETIFYPIPLRDAAEITVCPGKKDHHEFELTVTGTNIPGETSANLCTKAWQLIRNDFPNIPAVRAHLQHSSGCSGPFIMFLELIFCKLRVKQVLLTHRYIKEEYTRQPDLPVVLTCVRYRIVNSNAHIFETRQKRQHPNGTKACRLEMNDIRFDLLYVIPHPEIILQRAVR